MTDAFNQAAEVFWAQIGTGAPIWFFCFAILLLLSTVYFVRSWVYLKKRSWESFYFIILCAPAVLWAASSLFVPFTAEGAFFDILSTVKYATNILIPALVCFHVWSQVTYKPITVLTWSAYLLVPLILTCAAALNILSLRAETDIITGFTWEQILSGLFMVFVFARSYLLCFNVFYQMPKHMRLSTFYLITAITVLAAAKASYVFLPETLSVILEAIATGLLLERFFSAFYIANSSNVIVTSREFIFGNLSTIVLTVSRKGRILDWNKKGDYAFGPLPQPTYKQPFEKYREQFITEGQGKVSAHDGNIVTTNYDGVERHYLFLYHEIRHRSRLFGYLVEVSEVTKIYSVLRFLEEIAMIDQLTGMYNRNAYINMARAMASSENLPLLVMVGDVNNLKKMNDTVGHLCGDKLLITIARLVLETAPEGAFVARIGGDELVLLKPNGDASEAELFMDAITRRCDSVNDPEFGIPSISWGYAIMTSPDEEYNSVFSKADIMMLEKKKSFKEGSLSSSGFVPPMRVAE